MTNKEYVKSFFETAGEQGFCNGVVVWSETGLLRQPLGFGADSEQAWKNAALTVFKDRGEVNLILANLAWA